MLEPVIARYRERGIDLYVRADAAFAKPEIYELLEAEDICYAIRLPAKQVIQRRIGHLLTRPVDRPLKQPIVSYASFHCQANGWTKARRVVGKVEWHHGELYPRVGFIVTNLSRPNKRVVKLTVAGGRSSGSRKARTRSAGRGCPAMPFGTTRCGPSFTRSRTTSPTSCAAWSYRRSSSGGRSRRCARRKCARDPPNSPRSRCGAGGHAEVAPRRSIPSRLSSSNCRSASATSP